MIKHILYMPDDTQKELPLKWCICGQCSGEGKSSAYLGAYTADEMDMAGPEFEEDYFAGNYDRACDRCGGTGKIQVVAVERLSVADKAIYNEQLRQEGDDEQERRMEMRMGT